ncbi:dirigent protein 19-like [Elaeis guineensis]|uniref:Dirigent protein n=1 Tax=Elaeis guineensis var. tenera TaxID=51953 RepID=A0A6J0PEI5_ELAGV|nr:dirigent protein 19-like [Elaeis guineensis]
MAWFLRSLSLPLCTITFILFSSMAISASTADLFDEFKLMTSEKKTNLRLYLHDIVSGRNFTTKRVVTANALLPPSFGDLIVLDDPLTAGPSLTSELVGRAQGFYVLATQPAHDPALALAMNFVFVAGEYNGSTLTIMGRNAVLETTKEMPVVGRQWEIPACPGICYR